MGAALSRCDLFAQASQDRVQQIFPKTLQPTDLTQSPKEIRKHTSNIGSTLIFVKTVRNLHVVSSDANSLVAEASWQTEEERKKTETQNREIEATLRNLLSEQHTILLEQARQIENARQLNERLHVSVQQVSREPPEEQTSRYTELLHQRAEMERESAEKIASLQERMREETQLGEERLAALRARHEEERRTERDQIRTFVIAVETRLNRIVSGFDELQVAQVAESLYEKFNVRLVAATCGLTFVLETTVDQWARLGEHQVEIQEELLGLIPEEHHDDVTWQPMTECPREMDLTIGNPLHPTVSSAVTPFQAEQDTDQTLQKRPHHEEQTVPKVLDVEHSSSTSPSPSPPSSPSSSPSPSPEAREDNSNADINMFIYGNVQIADNITNNDNTELIAKLVWDADRERERANRLEQERQRQLSEEEGRQRQLSEEEGRQHSEQLAAMTQQRDDLRSFVLTLDERISDLTTRLEESQVNDVATRLYENFNVRLLGVESGLACILDIPAAQWETVVQRQSEIQDILTSLVSERRQDDVTQWNLIPSPDDVDIRLAREVQASSEERAQAEPDIDQALLKYQAAATFDPVSTTLEPGPSVKTSVKGDWTRPWITAMISYLGAVFMADNYNSKIKVFSLTAPHQLQHCLRVDRRPCGLAMVTGRQLLAVTLPSVNRIQLIDVTATPFVSQSLTTPRRYEGVGSCDERTLVVSCPRDRLLPASVDIITLEGEVVRTVTSSDEVEDLVNPCFLCVSGGTIYISDYVSQCVHQTDMETGQLTTLPRHPKLEGPRQVTVDPGGNLYVASYRGECVLVRTAAGEWRELLQGERHGEGGWVCARCVCVTDTGLLLVGWGDYSLFPDTVVKVYQFT